MYQNQQKNGSLVDESTSVFQILSLRSLIIGAIGSAVIGVGVPYCMMVLHGSPIASYFNTPAALILFFLLVSLINAVLGLIRRSWLLRRAELALIAIMWIVATSIPEYGLNSFLLPILTSVVYYDTPENDWFALLHPFIRDWIIPHHEFAKIKDFYEGAPQGQGIPWAIWLRLLGYWLPFILALYLAMISIMTILRKQWIEHERLVFPLAQLPIAMIGDDEAAPALIKPFFRNGLMWLGFALPALVLSANGLSHYSPFFSPSALTNWGGLEVPLLRDTFIIKIALSFQMIGFSYFINHEIALGLCFFSLLNTFQQGIFDLLGVQELDPMMSVFTRSGPLMAHQGFGAIIVLVLFGLWISRHHLRSVLRKALRADPTIDDSGEILSYRTAVFMLAGSLLFMGFWLWQSGLPGWITPFYLFFALVLFIGITRVVAEGGIPYIFAPMVASDFVVGAFGTRALGPQGILALAFTYIWASDILTFVMASCANGLKIAEETVRRGRRLVFWAMLLAIVVTLISSTWAILDLAYRHGGINTSSFFAEPAIRPFDDAALRIRTPQGPHWEYWGYTLFGGIIMGLLMVVRQRFAWWPFHPLGFPISSFFSTMLFSVLLALVIKTVVMQYGGTRLYLRTRPFFLGLILGQFCTAGLWYVIDYFTGTRGNIVVSW